MENDHERDVTVPVPTDDVQAENATNGRALSQTADLRTQKVNEYLKDSLDKKDPLQACLNAANADLLRINFKLGEVVGSAMGAMPAELAQYGELMPAIDCLLRINKQIDRFSQLDLRLTSAKASLAAIELPTTALGK